MDERPSDKHQALWERYMEVEQRKNGYLARALGRAIPGESAEELERLAEEDRHRAEEGLIELRDSDEVWYKPLDKITREDRQARIEAENARTAWLKARLDRQPRPH